MKKKVVGVYLAAGSSRRMGTAKQSLEMAEGVRLGSIALLKALHSELQSVVVVVREGDSLDWLPEEVHKHILLGRCRIELCADAECGMAHSLRTGIQVAEELSADGVLVLLADQPFIDGQMLFRLTIAFSREAGYDYIASGDKGMPKPPLILGRGMWPAAASLEGDAGARSLFRSPKYRGRILEEENQLKFMDIDTVDRYEQAKKIYTHHYMLT
ncbi:molybdenum cofactor cytidylyltransferase [Paenibacillus sp. yr247]|uniref:nucleotidyltransferase family protein n=1 Tax=Paenibacillus sp. yr247 TaxID=1761880 RepID=UPI0008906CB9|nr:nucleotidyltransferase family protein [Paenibacillus sp. yr247]SDO59606.1 molybdenum cofactor cytidylyltransferase [Paenibacillus sp. yr247]